MSRWQSYVIVSVVASVVMFTNLGGPRLWDRDEPRNAGCAAEMLARGDWIVPVFNAELRTHKPVLLYRLIMAAYGLFGMNEFAARLPSALLAVGTALCTYEMGRHLISPRAGIWSGIALATSLLFVVAGRAATPDATLIFCTTLAITLYAVSIPVQRGWESGGNGVSFQPQLSWPRALAIFGAMGFAVLAKGPVGIVLPVATIVLFQILSAPRRDIAPAHGWRERFLDAISKFTWQRISGAIWKLRPFTAASIAFLVAAPWYLWVGLRTDGEFLRGFFLEHNLGRALAPMEGHRGNVLFYPVTMLIGLFPWSILAVPVGIDLWQRLRRLGGAHPGYLLAGCWVAVYLCVFTAAKTKLPSYVTPCYPAMALFFGAFLDRWIADQLLVSRRWLLAASGVLAIVGLVVLTALPVALADKLPGESWLGLIGIVPVAAGLLMGWAIRSERSQVAAWSVAGTAMAFTTLLFAVGAERADQHQWSHRLLARIQQHSDNPKVAAFACLEPSWVFYGGRPIDEITEGQVGPTHSAFIAREGEWVPKPRITIADILAHGDNALVITTGKQLTAAQQLLPEDFQVLESVPLFLKDDALILLGRPRNASIARGENRAAAGQR